MNRETLSWNQGMGLGRTLRHGIALAVYALGLAACGGDPVEPSSEREPGVGEPGVSQQAVVPVKIDSGSQTVWLHYTAAYPGSAQDLTIKTEVVRLIDAQEYPGTIRIVLHKLGADIKDALVRAANKRIVVKAVVNGQIAGDTHVTALKAALDSCASIGCGYTICTNGWTNSCTWNGTDTTTSMHEKFITFTGTKQPGSTLAQPATWIGSANFEGASLYQRWNNSMTFYNATSMNTGMNAHFDHLFSQGPGGVRVSDYRTSTRGYFNATGVGTEVFMSNDADGDAPVEILRRYKGITGCRVRVMMSQITRTLPLVELKRLKDENCYVYIGVGGDTAPDLSPSAKEYLHTNFPGAQWIPGCHDKAVTLHAVNSNGVFGYYTLAGSHNWTENALKRNDELLTVTDGQAVHDAYRQHFDELWATGKPIPYP